MTPNMERTVGSCHHAAAADVFLNQLYFFFFTMFKVHEPKREQPLLLLQCSQLATETRLVCSLAHHMERIMLPNAEL